MLAAMLNWPQATFSSKVTLKDKSMEIVREIDEGLETVEVNLPAVVTCDLRLNQRSFFICAVRKLIFSIIFSRFFSLKLTRNNSHHSKIYYIKPFFYS